MIASLGLRLSRANFLADLPGARPAGTIRKVGIAVVLVWTLLVTSLRAVRLPNEFSKAHWLVDYRFGLVKRGLVGTIVSLATTVLHIPPTERLIDVLAVAQFVVFCVALIVVGLRVVHRSDWSSASVLAVLAFLSSPFIVMSAHLIGYFDNLVIVLAVVSLAMLRTRRLWLAASVQAIAILVHENALLICLPFFCLAWFLLNSRSRQSDGGRPSFWPLLLPVGVFLALTLSQSVAPQNLEQSLTTYLSGFPFIRNMHEVRVPHWIVITLSDSYALHRGYFLRRLLSQSMLGMILPSMLAVLGFAFDAYRVRNFSVEWIVVLGVCLVPQMMHLVAYDTARIWTYSILTPFLAVWAYSELVAIRGNVSQFVKLLGLAALALNITAVTPLMDGLSEHFELTTRLVLYAPIVAAALYLIIDERAVPAEETLSVEESDHVNSGGRIETSIEKGLPARGSSDR